MDGALSQPRAFRIDRFSSQLNLEINIATVRIAHTVILCLGLLNVAYSNKDLMRG